ncbi:MAG: 5'/3'-nucleotidase SurE [Bacteroidetes bacterium HGW-Bacteroidetes-12]|nr:MAG: 5'/3'-nucleotidase SurE [Bacteroidetes bacterium HGW-Bacteroidetes-12]
MKKKPYILIVNDDGITAPGIKALIEVSKELGDVVVVAPDKPQSGMGHAITFNSTLHIQEMEVEGVKGYACSGTPVDCVKIAVSTLLAKKPDLIVSGINHGSNSSINVIYSGTMSAAVEGALQDIPSVGFSLLDHSIDANFSAAKVITKNIIGNLLSHPLPKGFCLNVNIPNVNEQLIAGIKICRQAKGNWVEDYDARKDPMGRTYYWLTGKFIIDDEGTDTDEWALANNYVSVVPVKHDITDYEVLKTIKWLENEKI